MILKVHFIVYMIIIQNILKFVILIKYFVNTIVIIFLILIFLSIIFHSHFLILIIMIYLGKLFIDIKFLDYE